MTKHQKLISIPGVEKTPKVPKQLLGERQREIRTWKQTTKF